MQAQTAPLATNQHQQRVDELLRQMYSAALKMMHARATGGDIAMAGVDLGGGAPPAQPACGPDSAGTGH